MPAGVVPARLTFRQHVRDEALTVAHALTVQHGWERVRLNEVAALAGVSRPTLYKEFGDKQGLGDALVLREADRFLVGINAILEEHAGDPSAAVVGAVRYTLDGAAESPLLRAVLTSPSGTAADAPTGVLPLLGSSAMLLQVASERLVAWFTQQFPDVDQGDVGDAVDALVRLTVSHLVLPAADSAETGRRISEVAMRYLGLQPSPSRTTKLLFP